MDEDVKMYFQVEAAAMDAFIACWDAKMYYDFARPYTLVHYYFKDKNIRAWAGPEKGWMEIKGENWRPYSPDAFLCIRTQYSERSMFRNPATVYRQRSFRY